MREIKFRAWDEGEKCFFCNYIKNNIQQVRADRELHGVIMLGYMQVIIDHGALLEQFTGLHDKNGKEIYEGDILSQGDARFVVKWDNRHAMYKCFFVGLDEHYCNLDDSYINEFFEVVGNIHENPELLK